MKKKFVMALVVVFALALAAPALAGALAPAQNQEKTRPALTPEQRQKIVKLRIEAKQKYLQLTPKQKEEIIKIHQQMLELRKQMVDKNVEYGCLTSEQGQQIKDRIEARQKRLQENPDRFINGHGFRHKIRQGKGHGFGPREMMNGGQNNNINNNNNNLLTDN